MDAYAESVKRLGVREDDLSVMDLPSSWLEQAFCSIHRKMPTRALNVKESTRFATWYTLTGILTIPRVEECWNS